MFRVRHGVSNRAMVVTAVLSMGLFPTAATAAGSPTMSNIGTVTEPAIQAIASGKSLASNPTGLFASFDISWVDNARDVYYLADRSNDAVDEVDATDGSFIQFLGQGKFAGVVTGASTNRSGPDGVVTDKDGNVWVGDGFPLVSTTADTDATSHLKGFDPTTNTMFANIPTGGTGRADELAFGNFAGGRILVANPDELNSAFVSLVDTSNQTIIGKVVYDEGAHSGLPMAGHGFNTNFNGKQNGLEQSVFLGNHFYLNVPSTIQNPFGEIDQFDANTARITAVFPLTGTACTGTGLAVGPRNDLIVECADSVRIMDTNGNVEASFPQFGGADEIWFNAGDGNAYFPLAANAMLRPGIAAGVGILDVVHNTPLGITPVMGAQGIHSIAVDAGNGRVFLPISDNPDNGAGGIAMLSTTSKRRIR